MSLQGWQRTVRNLDPAFCLLYFFLPTFQELGCFSGCLMSSGSIHKLYCGIYSTFKCSFDEIVWGGKSSPRPTPQQSWLLSCGVRREHAGLLSRRCRKHKRCGFDPWVRKIPWSRKWQPTPVFLPRDFHGQRSLVGYGPWGRKELGMTEVT